MKTLIPKVKKERRDIETDVTEIKWLRHSCEQLKANKSNNLDEMNIFLDSCNLPRLNHEEINNMNKYTTS